jgi:integrase
MKSINGFEYLYLRQNTFYFRFILRKHRTKYQIMLSLQTQDTADAVMRWQKLCIEVKKLKRLVLGCKKHQTDLISRLVETAKTNMKQQLKMHHIDPIIAELEQSYNDNAHLLKFIGNRSPFGFPANFGQAFYDIVNAGETEEIAQAYAEFIENLTADEKPAFIYFFACVLNSLLDSGDEVNEQGLVLEARELLTKKGFAIDERSMAFNVLLSKLKSSTKIQNSMIQSVAAEDAVTERQLSQLLKTIEVDKPDVIAVEAKPLFSEVYQEFLDHKITKEKLEDKVQKDYKRKLIVWQALTVDKPIDKYTPQDIGRFIYRCFELPKMNLKPYNKMTWPERLEVDVPEQDMVTPKSVSHYYKWLQSVFAYAKRDTIGYITISPCMITRDYTSRVRGVFDSQELRQLLAMADKESQPWKKWIIYLGIYTGARRGELVQLRIEDVKLDSAANRYYLLITDEHDSQKLKTDNAKRKIPLHQAVIDAGFIEYVKSCNERVFYEVINYEVVTAWFARHIQRLGIASTNELNHIRSFHSFRHTFITKLMNNKDVQINLLQQVVGHEISSFGITKGYTHKPTELEGLFGVVDLFGV